MKKICALILTLALCCCTAAVAESNVYDLLTGLMNGRTFTQTLDAENVDGIEGLEEMGRVNCTAAQADGVITLSMTCESDAYLLATAAAGGVHLETNLVAMEPVDVTWETLAPNVAVSEDDNGAKSIKIGMTGPDREMINFSVKVKGADLSDYQVEFNGGFITGPGAVYSLWDCIGARDGSSSREFAFTYDEHEVYFEAEGEETVTEADGGMTIDRTEELAVSLDEEEIGALTLLSALSVQ